MRPRVDLVGECGADGEGEPETSGRHARCTIRRLDGGGCGPKQGQTNGEVVAVELQEVVPGYRTGIDVVVTEWPYEGCSDGRQTAATPIVGSPVHYPRYEIGRQHAQDEGDSDIADRPWAGAVVHETAIHPLHSDGGQAKKSGDAAKF